MRAPQLRRLGVLVIALALLFWAAPARAQFCDKTAAINITTNGTTELVALASGKTVIVCGFVVDAGSGINSVAGADPGAGAEISDTVPTSARWRLLGVTASLVTSATVANREVAITFDDGANVVTRAPSRFNHAASLTRLYSYSPMFVAAAPVTDNTVTPALPDVWMPAGYRIKSVTANIQAGDDWGAPRYFIQEASSFKFVTGTGSNCVTGTADISGTFEVQPLLSVSIGPGAQRVMQGALSSAVCIVNNRPTALGGTLTYGLY